MVNNSGGSPDKSNGINSEARLNVLYSPFRKKEINPQDWESKMSYWKNCIKQWCFDNKLCIFSVKKLQSVFVRNGRSATCLSTVIEDMISKNEAVRLQDLLSSDPSLQSWSSWAVNWFVKAPVIWSFNKLKDSLLTKPGPNEEEEFIYLEVLKRMSEQLLDAAGRSPQAMYSLEEVKVLLSTSDERSVRAVLHYLQLQGRAAVTTVWGRALVKLGGAGERVRPLSETDLGVYRLQQNEQALTGMLEQLEVERQQAEEEARSYVRRGMRSMAKTCLRKKKELEKCISKRASALENIQVLLTRVKEAESDKEILDSYKMGLSALKSTFKDAGLSEEGVHHTMDQVKEVLEVHEEVQNALSEPMADSVDADLESELAELLQTGGSEPLPDLKIQDMSFSDLPEPPTHSPTSAVYKMKSKVAQSALN